MVRTLLASLILSLLPPTLLPSAAGEEEGAQERLETLCGALMKRIEEFTGVPFGQPVPVRLVTAEWLTGYVRTLETRLTPPETLACAQRLAERLHQVPRGYDLFERSLDLFERMVAGLYDCEEERFYVVSGTEELDRREFVITAAHELVHAHRDIHTDFWERTLRLARIDSDATFALRCFVEGDANLLGTAIAIAHLSGAPTEEVLTLVARNSVRSAREFQASIEGADLAPFPAYLRRILVAPYTDGQVFAARVATSAEAGAGPSAGPNVGPNVERGAKGGAAVLRRAFDQPPRSTEQILHPEKYEGPERDEPVRFSGGDPTSALGEEWVLDYSETLGELEMRIHFGVLLGAERARAIAAGWDGVRFFHCRREGASSFLGLVSAWDSEQDAWEFARGWTDWATRRDGARAPREFSASGWLVHTAEGLVQVRVAGSLVVVADGVPPERAEAVLGVLASASR